MTELEVGDRKINVDDEGYLVNFDDWNEQVASELAAKEGIGELTREKVDILKFIRDYYSRFNFFPILHSVCKNVHQPRNCVSEGFMDPLLAWKIAGLPKPDENIVSILRYGQTPG